MIDPTPPPAVEIDEAALAAKIAGDALLAHWRSMIDECKADMAAEKVARKQIIREARIRLKPLIKAAKAAQAVLNSARTVVRNIETKKKPQMSVRAIDAQRKINARERWLRTEMCLDVVREMRRKVAKEQKIPLKEVL